MSESDHFPEELILQRDLDALPIHNIDDLPASPALCGSQWKSPVEGGFRIGKIVIVDGAPEIRWAMARVVTLEGMAADLAEAQRLLDRKGRSLRDADKLYVGVNQILTDAGIPEGPLAYRLEVALRSRRDEAKQVADLCAAAGIPNGPIIYQVECAIARLRAADLLGDQAEVQRKVIELRKAAAERDGLRAELEEVKRRAEAAEAIANIAASAAKVARCDVSLLEETVASLVASSKRAAAAMEEARALREAIGPERVAGQVDETSTLGELAALRAERTMAIAHLGQLGESREFVDVDEHLTPIAGLMLGVECGKTMSRDERLADIRAEARKMREHLDALGNPGRLSDVLAHRLAKVSEERQRLLDALDALAAELVRAQAERNKARAEADSLAGIAAWVDKAAARGDDESREDALQRLVDRWRSEVEAAETRARTAQSFAESAVKDSNETARELAQVRETWRTQVGALQAEIESLTEERDDFRDSLDDFAPRSWEHGPDEQISKDGPAVVRDLVAKAHELAELETLLWACGPAEVVAQLGALDEALQGNGCDLVQVATERMEALRVASERMTEADRLQKVITTCIELLGEAGSLCDDGDLEAQLRSYIADTTQQEMAVVEAAASAGIKARST